MRFVPSNLVSGTARQRAVTLLELMVAVSLLSVIVLGLYGMFNRTQDALRQGTKQVDVLESGRAAFELMVREIEQARTCPYDGAGGFWIGFNPYSGQVTNTLVDGTVQINDLQMIFFLKRDREWKSIAYALWTMTTNYNASFQRYQEDVTLFTRGVAALYRYERTVTDVLEVEQGRTNLFTRFLQAYLLAGTNDQAVSQSYLREFTPVANGVVNLQIRAYTTNGTMLNLAPTITPPALLSSVDVRTNYYATNAMGPAYVEVELSLLDSAALDQARALAFTNNAVPVQNFLSQQAGSIHMFRQRIPIRTVAR